MRADTDQDKGEKLCLLKIFHPSGHFHLILSIVRKLSRFEVSHLYVPISMRDLK